MMLSKEEFVEREIENMKRDLGLLVSHPSVFATDGEPFGLENQKVLADALKLMQDYGLRTKNLENYCGYGEAGSGEKLVGILAHLDVVPAGEGWSTDPYTMVEKDGVLYGRGVSDDKGGAVASLYALKYLLETGYPFRKRVRLILGCNEESGSRGIAYYVSKEGHIDCGFTPDADFPGIFAEKGMISGSIRNTASKILSLEGGEAGNIVCRKAKAVLPADSFDEAKLDAYLKENEIPYTLEKGENWLLTTEGIAAHASLPDLGKNALSYLLEALHAADFNDELTDFYHEHIGLCVHGEKLGLEAVKDEYTDVSWNCGVARTADGVITISVDSRFPVTRKAAEVLPYYDVLKAENTQFVLRGTHDPLFFDREAPMIKALMKAYQDVTGDTVSQMQAIGGGTYAKAIHNCVAFGCAFEGEPGDIHNANEYLYIESFKKQVLIYIEAIKNLDALEI